MYCIKTVQRHQVGEGGFGGGRDVSGGRLLVEEEECLWKRKDVSMVERMFLDEDEDWGDNRDDTVCRVELE